jgi:hypothetical protein
MTVNFSLTNQYSKVNLENVLNSVIEYDSVY